MNMFVVRACACTCLRESNTHTHNIQNNTHTYTHTHSLSLSLSHTHKHALGLSSDIHDTNTKCQRSIQFKDSELAGKDQIVARNGIEMQNLKTQVANYEQEIQRLKKQVAEDEIEIQKLGKRDAEIQRLTRQITQDELEIERLKKMQNMNSMSESEEIQRLKKRVAGKCVCVHVCMCAYNLVGQCIFSACIELSEFDVIAYSSIWHDMPLIQLCMACHASFPHPTPLLTLCRLLADLEKDVRVKDMEIDAKNKEITAKNVTIDRQDTEIEDLKKRLALVEKEFQEKVDQIQKLLHASQGEAAAAFERRIWDLEQEIKELKTALDTSRRKLEITESNLEIKKVRLS
jgi:predicted RNase H-like nuclease (RuvC/YqgF family)